ncbi:hypothetical protein [Flavobacterium sp. FlaQc-48]
MLEKFLKNEGTERLSVEEQKSINGIYSPEFDCNNNPATDKEYAC